MVGEQKEHPLQQPRPISTMPPMVGATIIGNFLAGNNRASDYFRDSVTLQDLSADLGEVDFTFSQVNMINAHIFAHKLPGAISSYHYLRPILLKERMAKQGEELGAIVRAALGR